MWCVWIVASLNWSADVLLLLLKHSLMHKQIYYSSQSCTKKKKSICRPGHVFMLTHHHFRLFNRLVPVLPKAHVTVVQLRVAKARLLLILSFIIHTLRKNPNRLFDP